MHKSKLGGFIIDCRTNDLQGAADFWGGALGLAPRALGPDDTQSYRGFHDRQHGLDIEVQQVEHPSRVHLDIETNDIEAEVQRLEGLGAKRVQKIRSWWVMEAPTGQKFCVVHANSPRFEEQASVWP